MKTFLSIVGARPQFIKAAMIALAADCYNHQSSRPIKHRLLHTGQHYDKGMSDVFFQQLPLPEPDYRIRAGSGTHGAQTATMLEGIERVLLTDRPDFVVVYGDTNSTLAGGLAAAKLHIPVAHVEAGLRSFNRHMPEEINRVVVDHLSAVLFCPTEAAVRNLAAEGISQGVYRSGDVMLDATLHFANATDLNSPILSSLKVQSGNYLLATIHRAENTDSFEQLEFLLDGLVSLSHPVIFPMHPRVKDRLRCDPLSGVRKRLESSAHIRIIDPVPYLEMLTLEKNARIIVTDSGGVQKESYFLGVPCITLRDETEWTETLAGGWNRIVGNRRTEMIAAVESLWERNGCSPVGRPNLEAFGAGRAAEEHISILLGAAN